MIRFHRQFGIIGTVIYGLASAASITVFMISGITRWVPPWYFILPMSLYIFLSAGFICIGRIEANRANEALIQVIKEQSDENVIRLNRNASTE